MILFLLFFSCFSKGRRSQFGAADEDAEIKHRQQTRKECGHSSLQRRGKNNDNFQRTCDQFLHTAANLYARRVERKANVESLEAGIVRRFFLLILMISETEK